MKLSSPLLLAALSTILAACNVAALDVGPPVWGFDGTVVSGCFNVISFEVSNRSGKPFEGNLVLDDAGGLGTRSSAPYEQPVYLAPGTSRWVQFHPYIGSYTPSWRLAWDGTERGEIEINRPNSGPPATVLLADPNALGMRAARMRLFPENLFPATVSATDALHAVVLDHQPRWEGPRRQAFLDWVMRGGIVHLLPGPDGAQPRFTEEFAPLNVEGDRGFLGAGLVVRHRVPRAEMTEQFLKDAGFPTPELKENKEGSIYDLDGFLFRKLASITRPNINWSLIYLLTAVYVLLIGPAFYLLRKRDYRLLLGGLIATVAVFAWLFTVVGRRGYGEKQIYHSLSIARALGGGRYDVQEWVHPFATSGDLYRFEHPGGGHLYAALGEGESVRGSVVTGKDSHFEADMPLFSSRPFLHRGVVATGAQGFTVEDWKTDNVGKLWTLRIKADPGIRQRTIAAVLEHGGDYSDLELTNDGFNLQRKSARNSPAVFFGKQQFHDTMHSWAGGDFGDAEAIVSRLRALHPVLISRANGEKVYLRNYIASPRLSGDRTRLLVYAEAPAAFALKSDQFQAGRQYVLYVQDLFKP
ncbi:MAG: hypothetical protein ABMA01_07165 [Chthoniobacteraceae bacterium]